MWSPLAITALIISVVDEGSTSKVDVGAVNVVGVGREVAAADEASPAAEAVGAVSLKTSGGAELGVLAGEGVEETTVPVALDGHRLSER